jgi:putative nucleotidyltransferase with HDIG domain
MFGSGRNSPRRAAIREKRLGSSRSLWRDMQANGTLGSLLIALSFFVAASSILMLREQVVPYRPGQYTSHDIVARVDFSFLDADLLADKQHEAFARAPRVYRTTGADPWTNLQGKLTSLPDALYNSESGELPPPYAGIFDNGTLTELEQLRTGDARQRYNQTVVRYVQDLRENLTIGGAPLVILGDIERRSDLDHKITVRDAAGKEREVDVNSETYSTKLPDNLIEKLQRYADVFELTLQSRIGRLTGAFLAASPTHILDEVATAEARHRAADHVPASEATVAYAQDMVIVPRGLINDRAWQVLRAENTANTQFIDRSGFVSKLGVILLALIETVAVAAYAVRYQPRIVRNHLRGLTLAILLLAMLLISELAAIGNSSLIVFGIAPTILAAIVLSIAYDQRFAIGISGVHALLVTVALNQGLEFLIVLWVGILTCCFLIGDIRTRSKLIEVGGLTAIAMAAAAAAMGAVNLEPPAFIGQNCLYAAAAALAAAFITLGILPFIEKTFRITTSMTLLELADASQPLLRRLAVEAPGTYNHSLQVAHLAEEACKAIGANALLTRVGAYYHDVGKINKADYFVENQLGAPSRHINLSPSVSLLIIIGHVKDGIELAREYNLPTSLLPFIQQHHGTTLVEYFYGQAQKERDCDHPQVSEMQYRYPGPKPKSKETAIVMIADCVESACRCLREPNAGRIEALVRELAMKRLMDGQFDECGLTMRDLEETLRSMVKTLLSIYHGRIAYPSTAALANSTSADSSPQPGPAAARSA